MIDKKMLQDASDKNYLSTISGFSLIELMVALAIIFIVLTPVYPILYGHYQTLQLEQEAEKLATFIEEIRQETSMSRKIIYIQLSYNERPHSYYITISTQKSRSYYLPENISLYSNFDANRFRFNFYGIPAGKGGTISLTSTDGKEKKIVVQPFSGLIDIR